MCVVKTRPVPNFQLVSGIGRPLLLPPGRPLCQNKSSKARTSRLINRPYRSTSWVETDAHICVCNVVSTQSDIVINDAPTEPREHGTRLISLTLVFTFSTACAVTRKHANECDSIAVRIQHSRDAIKITSNAPALSSNCRQAGGGGANGNGTQVGMMMVMRMVITC